MLTRKEINQRIRRAFLPFRCRVHIGDWDRELSFRVFDHRTVVDMPKIPLRQAQDKRKLEVLLSEFRQRIEDKGYALS